MVESIVNSLLFKPPKIRPYDFPSNRMIHLSTSNREQITAMMMTRKGATLTVLYSHGNAEDLNSCASWMKRISKELHVNIIGYDYTGYGLSSGLPSEENCYADIEAVFEYLTTVANISPHQIVLYGRSLGSGPSVYLAAKQSSLNNPVGGLMLHSPFSSVYRVVVNLGFTMVGDKFPNVDRIREVTCPVFVCHGQEDGVVPFGHGYALWKETPELYQTTPFWMEGVGHNDHGPKAEAELMQRLNEFLDYHILARRLYLKKTTRTQRTKTKKKKTTIPITSSSSSSSVPNSPREMTSKRRKSMKQYV